MALSLRDLDVAFKGAGQKAGIEIWHIENFHPVLLSKAFHGKFFMKDAYIILKTSALKSGALRHDIHYWIGKDTSQEESDTAALKTVELDASLGGRAVQYREVQGHETERFLSYFKPCIIPQCGTVSSLKRAEGNDNGYKNRLYICKGKHVVHVKEVPFARSSLSHDDIFILDTKSKIFQFNGSRTSIQEWAKALDVVQYLKDTYHDGKCDIAAVVDGKMMADAETGEFWGFFGGFAPLPRKISMVDDPTADASPAKLLCIEKGHPIPMEADPLTKEILNTNNCYVLDCGADVFVWMGKITTLEERKVASAAAEELLRSGSSRPNANIIRVIEGYETVVFRSKFSAWPQTSDTAAPEDGRIKIAALLKLQGLNVKGLQKATHSKEEPQPYIDCTGNLQVWRVNEQKKTLIPSPDQFKFYSGDCYTFQYNYPGEDKEEVLIGTWFGKKSIKDERASALSLVNTVVESMKFQPIQARLYEGKEPIQFFTIFQNFIVFKGGKSSGYKKHIAENNFADDTYSERGVALFRIQGSGPDNMQAIQVDLAATSMNSSYCYILHSGDTIFTWTGNLTSSKDQELVERQLDVIKPNLQSRPLKEGNEMDQFWGLLGGKSEYGSQMIARDVECEPHLFSFIFSKGKLKVTEIFNFTQDDLMTEDMFILDCYSAIYVWIGQNVDPKNRMQALNIAEKFLESDFLLENISQETPVFIITEENEPSFFTRFFTWDSAKSTMDGDSFERKLAIVKNGVTPILNPKPKRRAPVSYGGRSAAPTDKTQRSRSMSFSPDRVRVRGRSPAFNALAAKFENPNRNLSTPPPVAKNIYPKSKTLEFGNLVSAKSESMAAMTSTFEKSKENLIPRQPKVNSDANNPEPSENVKGNSVETGIKIEPLTASEDIKDKDSEDESLTIFPYERLIKDSSDPVAEIDVTKRETYLSSEEFKAKFGMKKDIFFKLPKWKQNKLKMALKLF